MATKVAQYGPSSAIALPPPPPRTSSSPATSTNAYPYTYTTTAPAPPPARTRSRMSPMLSRFTSTSRPGRERDAFVVDLNRAPESQGLEGLGIYDVRGGGGYAAGGGASVVVGGFSADPLAKAVHDIHAGGRRTQHYRSTSGTSQFSTATSGSGHRAGSFVHPFQQTPRPYTPPPAGSYQSSLREGTSAGFGGGGGGGGAMGGDGSESPAWTEDGEERDRTYRATATASSSSSAYPMRASSALSSRTTSRAGSMISTAAAGPLNASPLLSQSPLRIQTKHLPTSASRLHFATSNSDLRDVPDQISPTTQVRDDADLISPITTATATTTTPQLQHSATFAGAVLPPTTTTPRSASPVIKMSPISTSAIRGSIDRNFRGRTRSDASAALSTREVINQARREFEERERKKDEDFARREQKMHDRKALKEARHQEKHGRARRPSNATSRKGRSASDTSDEPATFGGSKMKKQAHHATAEFPKFAPGPPDPRSGRHTGGAHDLVTSLEVDGDRDRDGLAELPIRRNTTQSLYRDTKKRTHSSWTRFMIWLRTRLLRLRS